MRSRPLLARLAIALAVLTSPVRAVAATDPPEGSLAVARERFGAARKLEDAGRWGEALDLLQQVARVKMTPQVRFHIALCLENVGLWTQALAGYGETAQEAQSAAPDVFKEASDHIRALELRTPTVSFHVSGAASGDTLYLDRRAIPIDGGAAPVRADPGPHSAEVRRGDAVTARHYFTLAPQTARRIELAVGNIEAAQAIGTRPSGADGATDGHLQRTLGWSAVGLAGMSAVLTGVFAGLRAGALADLDAACPTHTQCPRSIEPTVTSGATYATLVDVFAITGVAAAIGGVVLLVTAPSTAAPPSATTHLALVPTLGRDHLGVSLKGAF